MTSIPVDFRNVPYKQKYIDEETFLFNRWFIFGRYEDGTVSVTDGTNDIFEYIPESVAKKIIKARDDFVDILVSRLCVGDPSTLIEG